MAPPAIRSRFTQIAQVDWHKVRRRVLIDSCIIIDAAQNKRSARELLGILPNRSIASVCRVESMGLRNEKNFIFTKSLVESMSRIDLDLDIQNKASALMRNGKPRKPMDAVVAATSIVRGIPLLTFNLKDFDLGNIDLVNYEELIERFNL